MRCWELAQVNIALPLEPLDSARLSGFVERLVPVNALADAAPGFVWRLQDEAGDATSLRPFEDERLMINMSVWESVESLSDFVFRTAHVEVMRRRREWFEPMRLSSVCWWVPAGTIPTSADAAAAIDRVRADGPTPAAFTLRSPFPPPGSDATGR